MSWLVVLAAARAQVGPAPEAGQHVRLTFANAGRTEDLVDFPVLVVLRQGENFDHARAGEDGADLRFVDADGVTVLPHDIELWDEDGVSTVWVSVPRIDAGSDTDHVWLETGAPPGPVPPADAVWPEAVAVWHLRSFADATGNGHVLSDDDSTHNVPGIAGLGRHLDGDDDRLGAEHAADLDPADAFTVSAWVSVSGFDGAFDAIVTKGDNTFRLHRCGTGSNVSFGLTFLDGESRDVCSAATIDDGGWHQIVGVYDRGLGLQTVYVDGVESGSSAEQRAPNRTDAELWIGSNQDATDRTLDGRVDEIRIEPVARSATWVSADYASVRNTLVRYCAPSLGLGDTDLDGICDEDEVPPDTGTDTASDTAEPGTDDTDDAPPDRPRNNPSDATDPRPVGCGCDGTGGAPIVLPLLFGWRIRAFSRRRTARGASGG